MQRSVVVVGAGPAGMAAAMEAALRGCRVTIIDEARLPGGQVYRQADSSLIGEEYADAAELNRKHRLLEKFDRAMSSLDYRSGCSVYAVFPNGEVHFAEQDHTRVLRPDAIVLATGVRELTIPFPGWTTPGVMFAGGAQAILKSQHVLPGRNAVVAGCGPLPIVVAAQLLRAGGRVAAVASLHPLKSMLHHAGSAWQGRDILLEGARYAWTILRSRVPRLTGFVPVRALGKDHLEAVVLALVDKSGKVVPGTERELACDLLAVNYGFVANSELAAMAGAKMRRDPVAGGWLPVADVYGRTSVPGILVAGDGAGLRGALIAESEGAIVGATAALGHTSGEPDLDSTDLCKAVAQRQRYLKFQAAVRGSLHVPLGVWALATSGTTVCRCENVGVAEILEVLQDGHHSLNAIKRNSRAGMGWCGGRTCLHAIEALAELHAGVVPHEMMTPRPMARPVAFAALARLEKVQSK